MKFWKRIFIYSMTLFLILFNGGGIFIIENIHKRSIDRTIKSSLDELKGVEGTLYLNTDYSMNFYKTSENQMKDWINLVINGYVFSNKIDPSYIEVYGENNDLIFSNSQLPHSSIKEKIINTNSPERSFIIKNIEDDHYLFTNSNFKIYENILKILLIKNINSIYEERLQNYELFLILDFFITLFLAIGMYLISKRITYPIEILSKASKEITEGNYSKRVLIKNKKDEIGLLAKNFNIMIESTETNIKKLKNLSNDKQRFIDNLTHEIKTPLTSIIGYSDLLIKGNLKEEVKFKALRYINSEALRLEKLSLTLLKLTLMREEEFHFNKFSIKSCINTVSKTLSYKIESKDIKLNILVEDTMILGEKELIIVLLTNILDNAIKASYPSGEISITGNSDDFQKYILTIKDFGVGIPEEDLEKITEPFYMVDKVRDRSNSGVGLGLAICKQICDIHDLELSINSKINKGTEIIIKFNKELNSL